MRDPEEGVTPDGHVRTGVRDRRLPSPYAEIVAEAVRELRRRMPDALHSVHLYGSVATGQARPPTSDVDLVAVLREPPDDGTAQQVASTATTLSDRHTARVREVGIAVGDLATLARDDRVGAAERAFLRHYCRCVEGPDLAASYPPARASIELAVGFNGDLVDALPRLRRRLTESGDPASRAEVGARAARKVLMAAATLLSARSGGWSTDRAVGAELVGNHAPQLHPLAVAALAWADGDGAASGVPIERILDDLGTWLASEYAREA